MAGTVSCNSTASSIFVGSCNPESRAVVVSPCSVQWSLTLTTSTTGCTTADSQSEMSWVTVDDAGGVINVVNLVQARFATTQTVLAVLSSRSVDAAGNTGPTVVYSWWVDATPPGPSVFVSGPDAVTVATTATFVVKCPTGEASPGQLAFVYGVYTGAADPL